MLSIINKMAGSVILILNLCIQAQGLELQRQFEFAKGDILKIDIKAGNIKISGNDSSVTTINAFGDALPLVEKTDNTVRIFTEKGQKQSHKNLDITVNLPGYATIDISDGAGDIEVTDVTGGVLADMGAGDIYLKNIGRRIDAETGAGNIHVQWQEGKIISEQCRLTTGVGNINLDLPDSANVQIEAQTGLGKISGKGDRSYGRRADLSLGSGNNIFKISTGIGNIDISGDLSAKIDWPENDILNWKHHRHKNHKEFHFGLGGGPLVFWPDRSAGRIQPTLTEAGFPGLREESYSWGGQGYLQFNHVRLGYMGWGQTIKARSSVSDTQRYLDYDYDLGGVTIEYVLLSGRKADIGLGAMLGGVDAGIKLVKSASSDLIWDQAIDLDTERELTLKSEGFVGMPIVRGKVKLFGIVWLQAQAGYIYTRMGNWKSYTEKEVFNAPKADHSGWIFAVGPHFGL
jgi:hypothetical protein